MDDTSLPPLTRSDPGPLLAATTSSLGGAGIGVGIGYLPAPGHTARVGGDWVDVVPCGCDSHGGAVPGGRSGSTAFTIGDVMGHGPQLAGRSHVARTVLAAALRDRGPAAALRQLDVSWRRVASWVDTMATACVVTATPATASSPPPAGHLLALTSAPRPDLPTTGWLLRWSSAGHPAPLLLTPDGTTTVLAHERADLPIGVDHTRPRREHTIVVPAGSVLLMFTDGVIEQRRVCADAGLAHLAALTAALEPDSRRDPAVTADRLLAARAPLLDTGDESTLLLARLDAHHGVRLDAVA